MKLRDYQQQAIFKIVEFITNVENFGINACLEAPTGAGKTILIAEIIRHFHSQYPQARFVICAHTKELIEQNFEKFCNYYQDASFQAGIYSAGLKRRDSQAPILFAGIQSVAKKAFEIGERHFLIIDEAHHIPKSGDGQYRKFIDEMKKANPHLIILGLTATPYRTKQGMVCGSSKDGYILNKIVHKIPIKGLIDKGYLSRPVNVSTELQIDTSGVKKQNGDFKNSELQERAFQDGLIDSQVKEIIELTATRKAIIIFTVSKEHCEEVHAQLQFANQKAGYVHSGLDVQTRNEVINDFKNGKTKFLVNVSILTEGFDCPQIDCVVMLKPTESAGLYYQCIGRGIRNAPGKDDCLVLDYGENVKRHGPIDKIQVKKKAELPGKAPFKTCPKCQAEVKIQLRYCDQCFYYFQPADFEEKELALDSNSSIISGEPKKHKITKVRYFRHKGKNGKNDTLRIEYYNGVMAPIAKDWVCLDHENSSTAFKIARTFMAKLTYRDINSVTEALEVQDLLKPPIEILLDDSEKFPKIIKRYY